MEVIDKWVRRSSRRACTNTHIHTSRAKALERHAGTYLPVGGVHLEAHLEPVEHVLHAGLLPHRQVVLRLGVQHLYADLSAVLCTGMGVGVVNGWYMNGLVGVKFVGPFVGSTGKVTHPAIHPPTIQQHNQTHPSEHLPDVAPPDVFDRRVHEPAREEALEVVLPLFCWFVYFVGKVRGGSDS